MGRNQPERQAKGGLPRRRASSSQPAHLRKEQWESAGNTLRIKLRYIRGESPGVAIRVVDPAHPVSPKHVLRRHGRPGARRCGPCKEAVNILNVEVEAHG